MKKEEDITWEMIIEECLKRPDDSIAQVFLEVQAKATELEEATKRIADYAEQLELAIFRIDNLCKGLPMHLDFRLAVAIKTAAKLAGSEDSE